MLTVISPGFHPAGHTRQGDTGKLRHTEELRALPTFSLVVSVLEGLYQS